MKSLLTLHLYVLQDVGRLCSTDIVRDSKTVAARCEDEGDSFLTITLPKFAKALERGLQDGFWPAQDMSPSWKHVRGLPAFMRGFLSRIFSDDGYLLTDPDTDCIWAVRQVCNLTQKVERECTPERVDAAFNAFVRTDAELLGLPARLEPARVQRYKQVAETLFGPLLDHLENKVANWELIPKHGPGAVAERASQLDRRNYAYWTEGLDKVFPSWRYTSNLPNWETVRASVPITDELPVRVVAVPKTQSTPRIIAIEPSSMQYAQQGLKREIYEYVGRGPLGKILGFTDQERNRRMAAVASVTGDLATLDLSEASDRVHWFLVYMLVGNRPHLWDFLWNTRSKRADVGKYGGIIPLQKFASMGSAVTFPMEAMVFTILAACGIQQTYNRRLSVRSLNGTLSVYGDDIIIPGAAVDHVIDWLEHFGAKVNRNKSFWNGKFRESCGAEYYDGHDVTVVRVRTELPSSRGDAAEIAALVDLRNRAYRAGLWTLVGGVDEWLEPLIRLPRSRVTPEARGYLTRETFLPYVEIAMRNHPDYQRPERRVPVLVGRSVAYVADGEAGLLEWFHDVLRRGDLVDRFISKERPTSFSIKRRWAPVHMDSGLA